MMDSTEERPSSPEEEYAAGEISEEEMNRRLKLKHSPALGVVAVVVAVVMVIALGIWGISKFSPNSHKPTSASNDKPSTSSAVNPAQSVPPLPPRPVPASATKQSRVQSQPRRPAEVPTSTATVELNKLAVDIAEIKKRLLQLSLSQVFPTPLPPPSPTVDLSPVERGLNRIADRLPGSAPVTVQTPTPQPSASESPLSDEERSRRYWEQYQRFHNQP